MLAIAVGLAPCGPAERGPSTARAGLTARSNEVAILEGDDTLVSGTGGAFGLRFDEARNDPGRVMARYVRDVADVAGTLILFTTFDDRGPGGPAYFIPVFNQVTGTGMAAIDQRAAFGTQRFEGFVNMKALDSHPEAVLMRRIAHEVAHRHLAHMEAMRASSTVAVALFGRQNAHWTASLDTDGSIMGGHGWMETTRGRFVVTRVYERFSMLDLYGLGLVGAADVPPFLWIEDPRTEMGAAIPPAAELSVGSRAVGTRVDLSAADVVRAIGERSPRAGSVEAAAPMHVVFAVLTEPGMSASSSTAVALAERVDALRGSFAEAWAALTRGRGRLCTTIAPCEAEVVVDAGVADAGQKGVPANAGGCRCSEVRPWRARPQR